MGVDYEANIQTIDNLGHHLVDDSWSTCIFSIQLLRLLMLLFYADHYSPLQAAHLNIAAISFNVVSFPLARTSVGWTCPACSQLVALTDLNRIASEGFLGWHRACIDESVGGVSMGFTPKAKGYPYRFGNWLMGVFFFLASGLHR